jgi:hypothetical protein
MRLNLAAGSVGWMIAPTFRIVAHVSRLRMNWLRAAPRPIGFIGRRITK